MIDHSIHSIYENDPIYRPLLKEFVKHVPAIVNDINQSQRMGNIQGLKDSAHRLKGSAATYGFPEIAAIIEQLEQTIRSLGDNSVDNPEVLALVESIDHYAQRITAPDLPAGMDEPYTA